MRVRSQAGLARLSFSNQPLVALAWPDATFVAGFKTWLRLGFAAKKGERAIAIIAPMPVKDRDRVNGEETGGEHHDQAPAIRPKDAPLTGAAARNLRSFAARTSGSRVSRPARPAA